MVNQIYPLRLIVTPNYELMSERGKTHLCNQLKAKPTSVLGLATGSSPILFYKKACEMKDSGKIDFSDVRTRNLDEYVGISPEYFEQTYLYFMRTNFFEKAGITEDRYDLPNWQATDLVEECKRYEGSIKSIGGLDWLLLGVGADTHIGFNMQGTPFNSRTHVVTLSLRTIIANSRCFMSEAEKKAFGLEKDEDPWNKYNSNWNEERKRIFERAILPRVPVQAMTMGIGTILEAKKILMLVDKATKAMALKMMLMNQPNEQYPASALWLHPHENPEDVTIIATLDAARELPVPWNQEGEYKIAA